MKNKEKLQKIRKIVKRACRHQRNYFGGGTWECHILPVINHSLKLGNKMKADLEILELAALLHDYANLVDAQKYAEEHHYYGAKFAKKILKKHNYSQDKIDKISDCILSHRGSKKIPHKSLESKVLASADAMSHITELADMFFLTYGIHKFSSLDGAVWLKNKIQRSWKKTMPAGKNLIKEDYKTALKILDKNIKRINYAEKK